MGAPAYDLRRTGVSNAAGFLTPSKAMLNCLDGRSVTLSLGTLVLAVAVTNRLVAIAHCTCEYVFDRAHIIGTKDSRNQGFLGLSHDRLVSVCNAHYRCCTFGGSSHCSSPERLIFALATCILNHCQPTCANRELISIFQILLWQIQLNTNSG